MAASTRAFLDTARGIPGFGLRDFLHGYVYGRWPYLYIGVGTGEHPASRWVRPAVGFLARFFVRPKPVAPSGTAFADTYHGKVLPLSSARELVFVREQVCLTAPEQVLPYARARDIILKNPDHIVALECPCRTSRVNPCLPLDVCLIVGEPFAAFVMEHHPRRARWIDSEEAAEILQAEHDRGHVHHAFFKDAMLGRFYAICNCCSCCCGAMSAHRNGTPMLASSGYVCSVDVDLCVACGICDGVCPFGALSLNGSGAQVQAEACMGCGVCVDRCPEAALSLQRDSSRGEPLDIRELIDHLAVS
jgi:ferredoxin